MSWRRIALILGFDLRHSVFRVRGLLFMIPFALCWYGFLRHQEQAAALFGRPEGFVIMAKVLDDYAAKTLLLDNPVFLSVFFVVAMFTAPFFVILAAHDQFASDLGGGFFRYLGSRCTRLEIFLGRYLSALTFVVAAYGVVAAVAVLLAVLNDGASALDASFYGGQIVLTLLLYAAPLVAYCSLISALCRSAVGALLLCLAGYVAILICMWLGNGLFDGTAPFSYLLPSGIRDLLFGGDPLQASFAASCMPLYALAYGWAGWKVFGLRNF
jgi:ABC-type transport system involved in multi-copper enzyme maturation permease subunit